MCFRLPSSGRFHSREALAANDPAPSSAPTPVVLLQLLKAGGEGGSQHQPSSVTDRG